MDRDAELVNKNLEICRLAPLVGSALYSCHSHGMELGWLDVCLRVSNVEISRQFYEGLGFRRVEGAEEEGWAVMVNSGARIGLFERQYMETEFSLNFRGGDVEAISKSLENAGYEFSMPLKVGNNGGASATLLDPDGHTIFFDCSPGETKLT